MILKTILVFLFCSNLYSVHTSTSGGQKKPSKEIINFLEKFKMEKAKRESCNYCLMGINTDKLYIESDESKNFFSSLLIPDNRWNKSITIPSVIENGEVICLEKYNTRRRKTGNHYKPLISLKLWRIKNIINEHETNYFLIESITSNKQPQILHILAKNEKRDPLYLGKNGMDIRSNFFKCSDRAMKEFLVDPASVALFAEDLYLSVDKKPHEPIDSETLDKFCSELEEFLKDEET